VAEYTRSGVDAQFEVYISGCCLLSHASLLLGPRSCFCQSLFLHSSILVSTLDGTVHLFFTNVSTTFAIAVTMLFKNLALLTAVAGTAVAEFAIITTPFPTNLNILTDVCSSLPTHYLV